MTELTHERQIEIQSVLQELSDYWLAHPELRLGQIIVNFTPTHDDGPFYMPDSYLFYMPDSYYRAAIQAQMTHEAKGGINV